MCASETCGGSTASRRITCASFSGSCGASGFSTFGASGAGPSRKNAVALRLEPLAEPAGRVLHPPVLGEPPRELLGRGLRLELGELGRLLREEAARLQLEQRGDEDEELAARLEVELVALGEALEEGEHDPGHVELPQIELVLQDERQQQVERAFERVEVELELPDDHGLTVPALPDAATRDGHLRPLGHSAAASALRLGGLRPARTNCHQTKNAMLATKQTSETQKLIRWPEEVVRRVDPQRLLEHAEGRVDAT